MPALRQESGHQRSDGDVRAHPVEFERSVEFVLVGQVLDVYGLGRSSDATREAEA